MWIVQLLLTALAAYFAAMISPGVTIKSFWSAIILAVVLALLNTFVKPILSFISLPVTLLTMGLFILVINALIIMLASWLMSSFQVDGFWYAMLYSVIFSVISWVLELIFG